MFGAVAKGIGGAIVGEVAVNLALNTNGFNKQVSNTVKGTEKSFGSAFSKIAKMAVAAFSVKAVWDFGKASVNAASQAQSAWTGLYSIVNGTGKSFAEAKGFLEEYISDGLVPLSNATTAYKNLAARGYSTEQIEGTLTALKDSASFGRQASYTLGDAVQTATEGLKNENSILVDNAGVTKNVAKMWEDYAASIGTTANNLTQAQKIQAEYNGIMEETKFQTGDAATYTNTFAGRTAQLSTAFLNLKTAVGKVVAPIASIFIPILVSAMNAVTRFFNKIQQLLSLFGFKFQDVVTGSGSALAGVGSTAESTADSIGSIGDSAASTAKELKRALGGMDELNILNNSSASSSGSGAGSGSGAVSGIDDGGLGSMFDNTIVDDPVSPQIKAIADKIKSYLEPLKSINFDNLVASFDKLKAAISPITDKLMQGLKWFWDNVLVPLTTWTIEDALPAFLNLLSGTLTFLNGVIEVVSPHLQWLWDNFLAPVAAWTGGVIVSVLNWIGEKLESIGNWLSENSGTIYDELEPLRTMLEDLKELIQTIWDNVLIPVINWIKENILPVIKPILDGILKSFQIVFGTIWNVLKSVWGVFDGFIQFLTGVFSGDWNKAWDGIKKIFSSTWDIIKNLFNGVVSWFGNKLDTLFNFFGSLWTGIKNIFGGIGSWFKGIFQGAWNGIKSIWSGVASFFSGIWGGIKSIFSGIGSWFSGIFQGAVNVISNIWSGVTNIVKAPINWLIDGLNSFIRGINKVKVPDWVPLVGGKGISIPQIPKLAQGGWVAANNPQLALIGDNKREGEIVTPESKIYDQVSKAIKDSGGTGNNDFTITLNVLYEDGRKVIQKINKAQIDAGKILLIN